MTVLAGSCAAGTTPIAPSSARGQRLQTRHGSRLWISRHPSSFFSIKSCCFLHPHTLLRPHNLPLRHAQLRWRIAVASAVTGAVQVTETWEPNSRVRLTVKVASKVCKQSYDEVLKEFSKRLKIPGFQVGKSIPEPILVSYVGKDRVKTAAVESVLRSTLPQALSSVAGRALKDSEHIVTKLDELKATFSPTSLLSYDIVVDVLPEVKWATPNAYKSLKVVVEMDDEASYHRAAEVELKSRYKDIGSLRIVQDRTVEVGDVLILDVSCNCLDEDGSEGDRILSAEQQGFQLDTDGDIDFLPGFLDAIIGMKREETRTFDLKFPKTWQHESLRGVTGRFKVYCKEHLFRVLPSLDDAIAGKLMENCSTLNEVREALLKKHHDQFEQQKLRATQAVIMDELVKVAEIEVPHSLLEDQGRNLYAAKLLELQAKFKFDKVQMMKLASEEMVNNYLVTQKERITDVVKQVLAVSEIYKLEGLKYSDEELKKEMDIAEDEFKRFNQQYDKQRLMEQATELLEGMKVMEFLMKHADISYVTPKS